MYKTQTKLLMSVVCYPSFPTWSRWFWDENDLEHCIVDFGLVSQIISSSKYFVVLQSY